MASKKPVFKPYDQTQLMAFPPTFEELIPAGHTVRIVDKVINAIHVEPLLEAYHIRGASNYHPILLLKVLVYGYVTNTYSSRKLAIACRENVPFMWLSGMSKPDHNTINRFRGVRLKHALRSVFEEVVKYLAGEGLLSIEEVYTDGTKIEANANKYTFVWKKAIATNKEKMKKQLSDIWDYAQSVATVEDLLPEPPTAKIVSTESINAAVKKLNEVLANNDQVDKKTKAKVNATLIENIPYYGTEFSIVELMENKGDFAIIEMEFDISKGSIMLEKLTGYLLNTPVNREDLAMLKDPSWRREHVIECTFQEELVPAYYLFDTLRACREMSLGNPELTIKYEDMNRNSLEDFQDQAKALKMPAAMQAEIEKQMETNVERIAVTMQMPARKGYLEATAHLKRGGGDSEYYYFNKYDLALNNKAKPLENDYKYMVTTTKDVNGVELEKPLFRKFDSPIAAIDYFNKQNGTSELSTGKVDDKNKLTPGQSLATMKDGKLDYVTKDFQGAFRNPVLKNTVYVNRGVGYNMVQSTNMLQGGAAHRDDLVSRQGVQYEAWSVYKFDEPRDNYGNLRIQQYGSGYGFKLEDELKRYEIKGLDDPKKITDLMEQLKDGERASVVVEVPGAEARKLDVEAVPRYGNINFFDRDGKPLIRETLIKPGMEKQKDFGPKVEQGKQKAKETGLGV
jgi:transposase